MLIWILLVQQFRYKAEIGVKHKLHREKKRTKGKYVRNKSFVNNLQHLNVLIIECQKNIYIAF